MCNTSHYTTLQGHRRQLEEKQELFEKLNKNIDSKIYSVEATARQKEMELSSTSSEIIAFQSSQISGYQRQLDELMSSAAGERAEFVMQLKEKDDLILELQVGGANNQVITIIDANIHSIYYHNSLAHYIVIFHYYTNITILHQHNFIITH